MKVSEIILLIFTIFSGAAGAVYMYKTYQESLTRPKRFKPAQYIFGTVLFLLPIIYASYLGISSIQKDKVRELETNFKLGLKDFRNKLDSIQSLNGSLTSELESTTSRHNSNLKQLKTEHELSLQKNQNQNEDQAKKIERKYNDSIAILKTAHNEQVKRIENQLSLNSQYSQNLKDTINRLRTLVKDIDKYKKQIQYLQGKLSSTSFTPKGVTLFEKAIESEAIGDSKRRWRKKVEYYQIAIEHIEKAQSQGMQKNVFLEKKIKDLKIKIDQADPDHIPNNRTE